MALFLLFQPFFERVHQLVPAHGLDSGFLFGAQLFLQHLLEPVGRQLFLPIGEHLHALEIRAKGLVKLVKQLFVFDQAYAGQKVEIVQAPGILRARADQAFVERFQQREQLFDRNRQFGGAQGVEKVDQHGSCKQLVTMRR